MSRLGDRGECYWGGDVEKVHGAHAGAREVRCRSLAFPISLGALGTVGSEEF